MVLTNDSLPLSADWYDAERKRRKRLRIALLAMITIGCTVMLATSITRRLPLLSTFTPPAWILIGAITVLSAVLIWRRTHLAAFALVLAALVCEQWPIAGLDPWSARTHVFQTISGYAGLPIPMSPAELILGLAVVAVVAPAVSGVRSTFYRGSLFTPMMLFLVAVFGSFGYGMVAGSGDVNVAWAEARSFVYMAATYVIVANVIDSRERLKTVIWIMILAIGYKGLQGINSFIVARSSGEHLEAITGHEDVVFLGTFFVLLAALLVYGLAPRQRKTMLILFLPVLFTEFATSRRIAFLILPAGFAILGLSLLRTRRDLLLKIVPPLLILLTVYTAVFWNHTEGVLGQPVRAFRSQIGFTSQRDLSSDRFRDLEKINIAANIKSAPISGLGFGQEYTFYVQEPDIGDLFLYWTYITHNNLYWVWMKMGIFGFILFWFLLGSAIVQGLVTSRKVSDPYLMVVALTVVAYVVMMILFTYGDLGLTYARPMIFLGALLGLLVRLPDFDAPSQRDEPSGTATKQPAPARFVPLGTGRP